MSVFSKIFYTFLVVFFTIISSIFSVQIAFAEGVPDELKLDNNNPAFIQISATEWGKNNADGITSILGVVQKILLQLVLPLVAIGTGLYIAYVFFTAEWDESKQKKLWTAVTYSIIGIVTIMLAYFVVDLISRISF